MGKGAEGFSREQQGRRVWELVSETSGEVLEDARRTVAENVDRMVESFYATLLKDGEAKRFIGPELVQSRLRTALRKWLIQVTVATSREGCDGLVARNFEIGLVHARINIPIHLVAEGMRVIKRELRSLVAPAVGAPPIRLQAVLYLHDLLDLMLEEINAAYLENVISHVRHNQSLKLLLVGHQLALECERLRSELFNWLRLVSMAIARGGSASLSETAFARSEFALWIVHRGRLTISDRPEYATLVEAAESIEEELRRLERLETTDGQQSPSAALAKVSTQVERAAYLLGSIGKHAVEEEAGRDPLTRLLSRRFLPTVLQQEVSLALAGRGSFGILLLDLDAFKQINDRYGHHVGDLFLTALSDLLHGESRSTDFVFRYGGDEFLVLLTEVGESALRDKAESLRKLIAQIRIEDPPGTVASSTVSIGAAVYGGHPDYQQILIAADQALYAAKERGGNQVVLFEPPGELNRG